MPYTVGDLVRVEGVFTSNAGSAVDPTVVHCSVLSPSGVTSTYVYVTDPELVRDAAGSYHLDVSVDEPGYWQYRFYSTGTGQAAGEGRFFVLTSSFT